MSVRHFRRRAGPTLAATLLALVAVAACEDDPFGLRDWQADPDTTLLYSLARPELNLPSAFNFDRRLPVRIEDPGASGSWDLALDTSDGQLVFLTPLALGINSRARITTFPGMEFDEVTRAPSDTAAYTAEEPVDVELGTVYVIRTSEYVGTFGQRCVYYAKLEPLVLDSEGGTVEFVYDSNPICNALELIPPED